MPRPKDQEDQMSALVEVTLIIEAGDTSGSLSLAAAALYQRCKLLIWEPQLINR